MSNLLCGIWEKDMQKCFLNKYTSVWFMNKFSNLIHIHVCVYIQTYTQMYINTAC